MHLLSDQQNDWIACHHHHLELQELYLLPCLYLLHKQKYIVRQLILK